jgi:PAS domain S-box-containing protein
MTAGTNNEQLIQEGIRDLRQNTDFISTLLENMVGYAIIAADFDGNIIAYNEGAHQIYGYTQEEVIGKLGIDIFFPRELIEAGKLQEIVNKIIEHGRFSYEGDKSRKNGESFPARIIFTLTRDNSSNIVGMIEIVADLTEQKKAEKRLRETAAEWQSTFNSMLDLVSIHDKYSRLVRVNRSFAEAHKMQPEDMVGKTCYEVCHKQTHPPAFCPHLETMETGKPSTVEYYDHLLGKHLEVTTSPMLNAEGEVFATVHVAKDITERSFIAKRLHDSKENLEQ